MTIHLKINMGFKSSSAAQSNMIKMASKKLQHFGNFNLFAMSDNIRTGYHIAIPDDMWAEDINNNL